MPQTNKTTINTDITNNIADNTSQDISAQDVRDILTNINDSAPIQDITASGNNAGAVTIDLNKPVQTITLTGAVTSVATTSRDSALSKMAKILFTPGSSDRATTWNSTWNWMGTKPSGIFANLKGLLTVVNFGSAETDIVAAFEQLGSGV
jgi:hypothetical protein